MTGLQGVTASAKGLHDLEADVSGANPDVIRVAHPKIDMSDIHSFRNQNAKMIIGYEIAGWVTRNDSFEPQRHVPGGKSFRWYGK